MARSRSRRASRRRSTTSQPVSSGLGNIARGDWSAGRGAPNPQNQLSGFYIGQVMDDQDEQRMGRVWVYIPGVSVRRFDDQSLPTFGGTIPDRRNGFDYDQAARNGYIMVSPMSPFFGSDDYRNAQSPDGRNSRDGDVNSYGMWHQPRVGDYVGVMFNGGDPNNGYWMGMVPKQNANGMVPSVPGQPASVVQAGQRESSELIGDVQPEALVPTMDRIATPEDPTRADPIMTSDLARSQIRAGVSGDTARGAGTSGARRESPSYVTGLKSAGWSYDSERYNLNTDGTPFEERVDAYYDRNSVGHSFTMDDHPDHQSMRLRTSNGAQILMQDSCANPFIYIQAASGNAWIEIGDSGDIMIYAGGGLHVHTEGDYNLTVDGDMNVEVGGSVHWRTAGTRAEYTQGAGTISYGSDLVMGVAGQYDQQIGDNARITYNGDFDNRITGNYNQTIQGGTDIISGAFIRHQSGGNVTFDVDGNTVFNTTGDRNDNVDGNINTTVGGSKFTDVAGDVNSNAGGNTFSNAGGTINTTSGGSTFTTAGGTMDILAGGTLALDTPFFNINNGAASAASDATAAVVEEPGDIFASDVAAVPILPPLNKTASAPTSDEIIQNQPTVQQDSVASVVPQHQPYADRCGFGSTPGTNGLVSSAPIEGGFIPPSDNLTCDRNSNPANIRRGAGIANAVIPTEILGGLDVFDGQLPVAAAATGYRTDSLGEEPNYSAVRLASEGETHLPDSLTLSEEGISYIKAQNTFIRRPTLDPLQGGYVVGYGHRVSYGDTIAGSFLNSDIFQNIFDFSNDGEKALEITQDEADLYLEQDLDEIETWVTETFPEVEFSQQQYDTLVAFAHNVTPEVLEEDERGQQFIEAIQNGNFNQAQQVFYDFSYVGGAVDCNVLDRRRREAARFGQLPDSGGITGQAIGYVPQGETVTVAGFTIESRVFNAICNAYATIAPQLPDGYLFTICAQESGFVPTAKADTSSAAGLFQFIRETGARYGLSTDRGLSSNVYDPVANANAGAQFNLDNFNTLVAVGITNPNATDLYMAHFLGAGTRRASNGASRFLTQPGSAIPANDSAFRAAARANRSIFFNSNGSARTYDEVYAVMRNKIERRLPYFQGICQATGGTPPPINPASDFQWVSGSRSPNFQGVDPRVRAIVERSALEAGISQLGFNSGFRDPATNERVDGARNSQHLFGKAIDINIGPLSLQQKRAFIDRLAANGITGMGVGTNTIHADIRNAGRVTWEYRGGNGFARDILQRYGYRGA